MSNYTDSASRPGRKGASGTDDRALFLQEFGGMVLEPYRLSNDYDNLRYIKNITQGKADSFPILGRKRDATEHEPGEMIYGGVVNNDEVIITLDKMLIDSIFIPEIDELISHFEVRGPYADQLGQSLGSANSRRIAIQHILASRDVGNVAAGQPVPGYVYSADMLTNGASLETAASKAQQYLLENDMTNVDFAEFRLPHAQVLLLARYAGVEGGPVTTGSGNRAEGTIGKVMGIQPRGTNNLPRANITTGNAKYQGDFTTTVGHISTRMAVGSLERRGLRVVMKDQPERLGTLIIASALNGHGKLRGECSIEVRTDAIAGRSAL
jgi:hypothetical protein